MCVQDDDNNNNKEKRKKKTFFFKKKIGLDGKLTDSDHLDTTVGEGGVDESGKETSETSGVSNANVRLHGGVWL